MDPQAEELISQGFVVLPGHVERPEDAFAVADRVVDAAAAARSIGPLSPVGEFVVPPPGSVEVRDFQTLHFDFGVPLNPRVERDLAFFTALHVPARRRPSGAVTRLVPLSQVLAQRTWPKASVLIERFVAYGETHGAWDDAEGYSEGSFARIVEAAAAHATLPSVKVDPNFLCGLEFATARSESDFFARHGVHITEAVRDIPLAPGQVLVFDNTAVAHGRYGVRAPGELLQRVYGVRQAGVEHQERVRDAFVSRFRAG